MTKLILFDIDGTLVRVRHEVTDGIINDILRDALGYHGDIGDVELHGKTDRQIMLELCRAVGSPEEEHHERCRAMEDLLIEGWRRHLSTETVALLPGVAELLEELSRRDDVQLALLTGNVEAGARMKLAPHDLNRYFPFGSYGSDAVDRVELPPIALERARAHSGVNFDFSDTLIVGDSHRDIACARAWGINALAVATGSLTLDDLLGYSPDAACSSLVESEYIFEFIARA